MKKIISFILVNMIGLSTAYASGIDIHLSDDGDIRYSAGYSSSGGYATSGSYTSSYQPRRHHHRSNGWVHRTSFQELPSDAVLGGYEDSFFKKDPLYICRANFNGGVHPGKTVKGKCDISFGGKEYPIESYEVLTRHKHERAHWVDTTFGEVPNNAIPGGHENGHPLYICQAEYFGGTHPGKVVGKNCDFPYGGTEHSTPFFKVLVS